MEKNSVMFCLNFFIAALLVTQVNSIRRCKFKNRYYQPGNQWSVPLGDKTLNCNCDREYKVSCEVSYNTPVECYDRTTRQSHSPGDEWTRLGNGRRLTCTCEAAGTSATISCVDNDICRKGGQTYRVNEEFNFGLISGVPAKCICLEGGKISCSATVEERPEEEDDESQIIREVEVHGGRSILPKIKSLQACDSGHQIIGDGGRWNQTSIAFDGTRYKEECVCQNAIVTCSKIRTVGRIEPICLSIDNRIKTVNEEWVQVYTSRPNIQFLCRCLGHRRKHCKRPRRSKCVDEDGTIYSAGEQWQRVHESFPNIRFNCVCHSNWTITCKDAGYCEKLNAPVNGAMLCAHSKGFLGDQKYCRPLCLQGYEFSTDMRYHRTIEVCGYSNLHRWSGGFVDDPLSIAKCKRSTTSSVRPRGHSWLYLPSGDCNSVDEADKKRLGDILLVQLRKSGFCGFSCKIEYFECGVKSVLSSAVFDD